MQKIDPFYQRFLRFVLPGYIRKGNACLRLHIDLGIALAEIPHAANAFATHVAHKELPQRKEEQDRQYPIKKEAFQRTAFSGNDL